ncbi:G8 domain-containing protein DDB_G0286311-like [Zophobas morio]|uniref:G8 domain-containing protein DDB_G0286311-like n=1 Tax=Zophobas morio TaxID=2755281 RepID=UPI003082F224
MEKLVIILGFFFAGAIFSVCSLPKDKVPTGNIVPYAGINDLVNSTVEGMRPDLPDPLVLEDPLNLNLTEDIINGTLDIQDIRVTGLKGLLVPYLLLVMPTFLLHFEFVVPVIEINAQYKTDIDLLGLLNVYGNGSARIALNNVQLKGTTVVSLSPSMSMKDLDIEVRLQSVDVDIQGLLYDEGFSSFASGLITLLAEWLIVPYVNNNASAIGDIVGPILEDVINGLLSGTTTVDPGTSTTTTTATTPTTTPTTILTTPTPAPTDPPSSPDSTTPTTPPLDS